MIKHAKLKQSFLLLTFFLLCLSSKVYAQEQLITLKLKRASLTEVFKEIEKQTTYRFAYRDIVIDSKKDISASAINLSVSKVLKDVLSNKNLDFSIISSKSIVIFNKAGTEIKSTKGKKTISGIIKDATGEPIIGANITIKGAQGGTITDIGGNFEIETHPDAIITVSYIGYLNQEISVKGKDALTITLQEDSKALDELVVVGYGTQRKSIITGSISSVKMKDVENQQIGRVEQVLQGRTTGLTVASSSGAPGAASTVRVRGATSLNEGANEPLYVVDGVVVGSASIDYLNTNDIESIEILKDAASAAIYGARSSSGVILITTKNGNLNDNISVKYSGYFGTQSPAKKLDLLNATQYAEIINEQRTNTGLGAIFPDPQSFGTGTDWQSIIFNNNANIQSHELSITGGTKKSTFFLSFGLFDQEGIVATDISKYERYNIRLNSSHKIKDWLSIGQTLGYSRVKNLGGVSGNDNFGGPLSSAVMLDPITKLYETDITKLNSAPYATQNVVKDNYGNYYGISQNVSQQIYNPMAYIHTRQGNYGWSESMVGSFHVEVVPYKGVKFRTTLGTRLNNYGNESFIPKYYLNSSQIVSETSFNRSMNKVFNWNIENTLTYQNKIDKHDFSILLGQGAYVDGTNTFLNVTYYNLPVDNFNDATMNYSISNDNISAFGGEAIKHTVSSFFTRATYNFAEKYLFTGIVRRDGSSRFGSNYKYGVFPSASLGWVPSLESFWLKNNVLEFLKIRFSYGITGNDAIGNFKYVSTVSGGRNYIFGDDFQLVGYSPDAPANPDLRWEETTQLNLGFDAILFQNFRLTFDSYRKKTSGILQSITIPKYMGATGTPSGNVADMENQGAEIELSYRKRINKDFEFGISGNASYLNNTVTFLGAGKKYLEDGALLQNSSYPITRTAVGQAIGSFYGFRYLGIFQNQQQIDTYINENSEKIQPYAVPGDFIWDDLDKNGKIDEDDRDFIGDPTPDWTIGFNIDFTWKKFDFLVFGQGVIGNQIFQGIRRLDIPTANWQTSVRNRWHGEGTSDNYPRLALSDDNKNFSNPSTFHLESGDYFRVKTVQLGYSLPKTLIQKIGISHLRLYVSANNLLTFTKYTGYDPEIGGSSYGIDRTIYPQARTFMAGLNCDF
ncbi:MAG: SusC/RagA family TonB-linked outer membrane protein [Porphyromonadaceae bacterium CG2_30_38_12]|nr:MAG: SusC/RagA family TonB-linked outer membrane protein [Porphyromonadaceae bacterium CG2_30_38_12]